MIFNLFSQLYFVYLQAFISVIRMQVQSHDFLDKSLTIFKCWWLLRMEGTVCLFKKLD